MTVSATMPQRNAEQAPVPILPVALLLAGRPCLVVGAGPVAARKAEHLVEAGARVTVIGERLSDALRDLHARGLVRLDQRAFADEDVAGCAMVFAATDDAALVRRLGRRVALVEGSPLLMKVTRTEDLVVAEALARRLAAAAGGGR